MPNIDPASGLTGFMSGGGTGLYTTGQSQPAQPPSALGSKLLKDPLPDVPKPFGDAGVVRPSSTTPKGFDPSYIQNLATSTGGMFARPSGGVLNFNPLGDLSDIKTNPLGGGNAPLFGLPQGLQQPAQNAAIAAKRDQGPTVPVVTPPTPIKSGPPNTIVPGSSGNLFFGPTGTVQPAPNSPLYNAIIQAYAASNWNFTNPPNLAPIYEQFGLMFAPGGGILINPPTAGGTTQ